MDHGQRNWKWPIVHLFVKDVFVVNNNSERQEDPDGYIGVRKKDLLQNTVTERSTLPHCGWLDLRGRMRWLCGGGGELQDVI